MADRQDALSNLFSMSWVEGESRYRINSMSGWSYDGPKDTPESDFYELEVKCVSAQHPRLRQMLEACPEVIWAGILGYESQGLTGAQRDPRAVLVSFKTPESRDRFAAAWEENGLE